MHARDRIVGRIGQGNRLDYDRFNEVSTIRQIASKARRFAGQRSDTAPESGDRAERVRPRSKSVILREREPRAMPAYSIHRASDERLIVERWLGRALSSEETITINAYRPRAGPDSAERRRHR